MEDIKDQIVELVNPSDAQRFEKIWLELTKERGKFLDQRYIELLRIAVRAGMNAKLINATSGDAMDLLRNLMNRAEDQFTTDARK